MIGFFWEVGKIFVIGYVLDGFVFGVDWIEVVFEVVFDEIVLDLFGIIVGFVGCVYQYDVVWVQYGVDVFDDCFGVGWWRL